MRNSLASLSPLATSGIPLLDIGVAAKAVTAQ